MPRLNLQSTSRRQFIRFLAASPLLAVEPVSGFGQAARPLPKLSDPLTWAPLDADHLITDPKEAINVFDFEPVMRKNVPPAHFGYMASGIDDEVTLRANREGFLKFQLRPRRLVDVSKVDMSADILGVRYDTRSSLPRSAAKAPTMPTARRRWRAAAKAGHHLMILSTQSTTRPKP